MSSGSASLLPRSLRNTLRNNCYDTVRRMKVIRYGLHFSTLSVAVVILWLARDVELGDRILNWRTFHYGLMGLLHATSIIVSLRDRKLVRPLTALGFATLAVVWSVATPVLAFWVGSIIWVPFLLALPANASRATFLFLLTGSVIGSSGYWMLVRFFWLRLLRSVDWLKTVGLCLVGTSLSCAALTLLPLAHSTLKGDVESVVLTTGWWFAFSLSLYWSETSAHSERSVLERPSLS